MSIAAFRKSAQHDELAKLAESHFKDDLTPEDRELVINAAQTVGWQASVGSAVGVSLGIFLAYRVRRFRSHWFTEFLARDKPTQITFASGKTVDVPDVTERAKPSRLGDFAAYFFLGTGGLFLGGETGFLTGTTVASRRIIRHPEQRARIENAYRAFRIDTLRKEADRLEEGTVGTIWG